VPDGVGSAQVSCEIWRNRNRSSSAMPGRSDGPNSAEPRRNTANRSMKPEVVMSSAFAAPRLRPNQAFSGAVHSCTASPIPPSQRARPAHRGHDRIALRSAIAPWRYVDRLADFDRGVNWAVNACLVCQVLLEPFYRFEQLFGRQFRLEVIGRVVRQLLGQIDVRQLLPAAAP